MGRSQSARELTQRARLVNDVDHEHLSLIRDPHPCGVKCPTKSRQVVVVHEHVDGPLAIPRERGQALDVHAAGTRSLTQASQLARAIVKNYEHVSWHLKSDAPTNRGKSTSDQSKGPETEPLRWGPVDAWSAKAGWPGNQWFCVAVQGPGPSSGLQVKY